MRDSALNINYEISKTYSVHSYRVSSNLYAQSTGDATAKVAKNFTSMIMTSTKEFPLEPCIPECINQIDICQK